MEDRGIAVMLLCPVVAAHYDATRRLFSFSLKVAGNSFLYLNRYIQLGKVLAGRGTS